MHRCTMFFAVYAAPTVAYNQAATRRAQGHGLLQPKMQTSLQDADLVAPQANDTITEKYWNMIDDRIGQYASQTEAPAGANEQSTSAASSWSMKKFLGFEIPGTSTPAPSQDDTSAQFVAQCPMIMFNTQLYIEAPKCGKTWGAWQDPGDDFRPVVRWKPRGDGGLVFGVDSAVNGEGSATYAILKKDLGLSSISFQLANCLGVTRYYVEEEVVKVNHVSQGVSSTVANHDTQASGEAFFYRYAIKGANGTTVAKTDLFRLNQDSVNVTMLFNEASAGPMVVSATRVGNWKGDQWRLCDGTQRGWQVTLQIDSRDMKMATTVMDLRVAATAVISLLAYRDESVDEDSGHTSDGQGNLFKQLVIATLLLIIGFVIFMAIIWILRSQGIDAKCRRFCFKLEGVCFPSRPVIPGWKQSPFQKLSTAPPRA